MAITVPRPNLNWRERMFLPAIAAGLLITLKHFKNMIFRRTKVTMQYPEEKWDLNLPEHYRGAPTLVTDEHGRERCVACQLCEFICPPRAITITPEEIPAESKFAKVEKRPKEFEIDMIVGLPGRRVGKHAQAAGHAHVNDEGVRADPERR